MSIFMGVVASVFGAYNLIALFVPGYRVAWKGCTDPAGRVTHLGLGLAFLGFGVLFAAKDFMPVVAGFSAIGGMLGIFLAAIGHFIDP